MTTRSAHCEGIASFGPVRLIARERRLTRGGEPVDSRGRAFDIRSALLSRPSQLVSKSELMARVWPGVIVEEGALRFHVAHLRRALGDGQLGARYIATEAGRGYCFVGTISRTVDRAQQQESLETGFPHA